MKGMLSAIVGWTLATKVQCRKQKKDQVKIQRLCILRASEHHGAGDRMISSSPSLSLLRWKCVSSPPIPLASFIFLDKTIPQCQYVSVIWIPKSMQTSIFWHCMLFSRICTCIKIHGCVFYYNTVWNCFHDSHKFKNYHYPSYFFPQWHVKIKHCFSTWQFLETVFSLNLVFMPFHGLANIRAYQLCSMPIFIQLDAWVSESILKPQASVK